MKRSMKRPLQTTCMEDDKRVFEKLRQSTKSLSKIEDVINTRKNDGSNSPSATNLSI